MEDIVRQFTEAVEAAQRNDCVAFWIVLPVSREMLANTESRVLMQVVADEVGDALQRKVQEYLAEEAAATE